MGFITSLNHHNFWIGICLVYCFPIICVFFKSKIWPSFLSSFEVSKEVKRGGGVEKASMHFRWLMQFCLVLALMIRLGRIREGSCFKRYIPKNRSWDFVSSEALYWKSWEAHCCCSSSCDGAITLSPIIIVVENGYIWKVATIGDTSIFHFHVYRKKGRSSGNELWKKQFWHDESTPKIANKWNGSFKKTWLKLKFFWKPPLQLGRHSNFWRCSKLLSKQGVPRKLTVQDQVDLINPKKKKLQAMTLLLAQRAQDSHYWALG